METLPVELLYSILDDLNAEDIINLCKTHRNLSWICRDEYFWSRKAEKDFGVSRKDFNISPADRYLQFKNIHDELDDTDCMFRVLDSASLRHVLSIIPPDGNNLGRLILDHRSDLFYSVYNSDRFIDFNNVYRDDDTYPPNAAIISGENSILDVLLRDPRLDMNYDNLLIIAIENGNVGAVKLLLERTSEPIDDDVIFYSLRTGDENLIRPFLDRDDVDYDRLLDNAFEYRLTDAIRLLLQYPVDKERAFNNAILTDNLEAVRILLDNGEINPQQALIDALKIKVIRPAIMGLFLDRYEIDEETINEYVIPWAIQNNVIDVIEWLLENNQTNPKTILRFALHYNKNKIVEMMLTILKLTGVELENFVRDYPNMLNALLRAGYKLNSIVGYLFKYDQDTNIHRLMASGVLIPDEVFQLAVKLNKQRIINLFYVDNLIDPFKTMVDAISNGQINVVRVLLGHPLIDPTFDDSYMLKLAIAYNQPEIVRLLLEDGRSDPTVNDNMSIRYAISNNLSEIVQLLLEDRRVRGAMVDNWLLYYAIREGSIEIVKLLLKLGESDQSADDNKRILQTAIEYNQPEIVELLLEDGRADPTVDDNWSLNYAAQEGLIEIVRLLLEDGRVNPTFGDSIVLQIAIENNQPGILRLLLIDGRANVDNSLLVYGAAHGMIEIVRLLLEDGRADPNANNGEALQIAIQENHPEIVQLLLEDGRADPTADSSTIQRAVNTGNDEIVKLLLADGRVSGQ